MIFHHIDTFAMNTAQNLAHRQSRINESLPQMHVEIWSDVMCPFCYIGKRRFEEALQHFPQSNRVAITWKSFQLDPTISGSQHGKYAQYLANSKGMSLERVEQMFSHVAAMGASVGLTLDFGKAVIANSHKAHQILHLASEHGLQDAMKEALLKAHFTDGLDIGDAEILQQLAAQVGLPQKAVEKALRDGTFEGAVAGDIHEAQHLGVQGVPFFVFNRQYAVSGAQEASVFAEVLQQSFEEWEQEDATSLMDTTQSVVQGEVCTPEGVCA
jgi:predicted DsbA family dithiol-disulfide isomerase